jgi:hypothetical protein
LSAALAANVTVVSVQEIVSVCDLLAPKAASEPFKRVRLEAVGTPGDVYSLDVSADIALPTDLGTAGTVLRLALQASIDPGNAHIGPDSINQTLAVFRDERVVLVSSSLNAYRGGSNQPNPPIAPDNPTGFRVDAAGLLCERSEMDGSLPCFKRFFRAQLGVGADTVTLAQGESGRLGPLTVSVQQFVQLRGGSCDSKSYTRIIGTAAP